MIDTSGLAGTKSVAIEEWSKVRLFAVGNEGPEKTAETEALNGLVNGPAFRLVWMTGVWEEDKVTDTVVMTREASVTGSTVTPDWVATLIVAKIVTGLSAMPESDMFHPPYPYPGTYLPTNDVDKVALVGISVEDVRSGCPPVMASL